MGEITINQTNSMIREAINKIKLKRVQEMIMTQAVGKWEDMSPSGYDFYRIMLRKGRVARMILTLPDPEAPDLGIVIKCPEGHADAISARNAAEAIREKCGPSDLTRLLDRLAEQVEWLGADPEWSGWHTRK